jgi:hypothetical protein
MQKVVIFGGLTALVFLFPPAARAQNADEVERLRKENELLKKEVELLKKEIELLKKEAKAKPDGAQSRTKASRVGVDFELVKCVRNGSDPTKVTFTFSAQCDMEDRVLGGGTGLKAYNLFLTARGGEALKGKVTEGPPNLVKLTRGVASRFQITYAGVNEDITELDEVELVEGNFGREVKFSGIKIAAK